MPAAPPGKLHHLPLSATDIRNTERGGGPKLSALLSRTVSTIHILQRRSDRSGQVSGVEIPLTRRLRHGGDKAKRKRSERPHGCFCFEKFLHELINLSLLLQPPATMISPIRACFSPAVGDEAMRDFSFYAESSLAIGQELREFKICRRAVVSPIVRLSSDVAMTFPDRFPPTGTGTRDGFA